MKIIVIENNLKVSKMPIVNTFMNEVKRSFSQQFLPPPGVSACSILFKNCFNHKLDDKCYALFMQFNPQRKYIIIFPLFLLITLK